MLRILVIIIILGSFSCKNCRECKLIFEDNSIEARAKCDGFANLYPDFRTTSVLDLGTDCEDLIEDGKIENTTTTLSNCFGSNVVATTRSRVSCIEVD